VVDAAGKELIAPSEILLNRDFSYSDAEILAKEAEEATLIRGMEQEALRQVLRRLSYIKR
jgi:LPS-assembly lipoprotein